MTTPEPKRCPLPNDSLGSEVRLAARLPGRVWWAVTRHTLSELISDRISLGAAGCAFYATLALFPAITMLIFIYGLVFDPLTVEPQLDQLRNLLPPEAFKLISTEVHDLVERPRGSLGIGLLVSVLFTLWSSATGTKSMLSALNMAYKQPETRGIIQFQLIGLGMTLGAILGAVLGIAVLVGLPTAIHFLGLSDYTNQLLKLGGLAFLLVFIGTGLALLYRFGPSQPPRSWWRIMPGTLLATVLWLVASVLFSLYVGRLATYDVTYGPIGAVAGVMMWFYVSVYVVLLGGEMNAALDVYLERADEDGGTVAE